MVSMPERTEKHSSLHANYVSFHTGIGAKNVATEIVARAKVVSVRWEHTEKSVLNRVNSILIWIVIALFRLIWQQFCLVAN